VLNETPTLLHCNTGQPLFNQHVQALTSAGLLLNNDGVLSVEFITEQLCAYDEYREQQAEKGRKSAEARRKNEPLSTNKKEERRKKIEESRDKKEDQDAQGARGHDEAIKSMVVPDNLNTSVFLDIFGSYCSERRDGGKYVTERSLKAMLNKLSKVDVSQAIEAVDNSIANGWQGVFPERNKSNGKTYGKPNQVIRTMPTAEEYEASENVERGDDGMPIFN